MECGLVGVLGQNAAVLVGVASTSVGDHVTIRHHLEVDMRVMETVGRRKVVSCLIVQVQVHKKITDLRI